MRKRRILGLIFLILGIIFLANSFSVTGFAVFEGNRNISGILSLVFIILGLLLMATSLEQKIATPEVFEERIRKKAGEKGAIVLDTSAFSSYSVKDAERILDDLARDYSEIFVPESVLREIKNPELRKFITEKSKRLQEGKMYKLYARVARKYLEDTDKPKMRRFLLPYLEGKKLPKTREEEREIAMNAAKVRKWMKEDGIDITWVKVAPKYTKGVVADYLNRNCQVTDADTDVLATALFEARNLKRSSVIGEKDSDFEQAVASLEKSYHRMKGKIEYANTYRQQTA